VLSGLVTPVGRVGRGLLDYFKKGSGDKEGHSGILLIHDRESGKLIEEKIPPYIKMSMDVLYGNRIGKKALHANTAAMFLRKMTIAQGKKYDDPNSRRDIEPFIKFHQLDENEILEPLSSFRNFNEFFYRKLKPQARPIFEPNNPSSAVSPADCRMMAFMDVDTATRLWIKGRDFSLETLLVQPQLISKYEGGSLGVFRLAPQDYHRFHVPVNGVIGTTIPIIGKYYTVNPIAVNLEQVNVFGENKRAITEIESPEFGSVCYVTVGATMVGSIVLTTRAQQQVTKGDEHGYFAFGGSTIILLFQRGRVEWDEDLINNSLQPVETLLKMGQSIGRVPKGNNTAASAASLQQLPPRPSSLPTPLSSQPAITRKRIALRSSNGKYLVCAAETFEVMMGNFASSDSHTWFYEVITDEQEQHILEQNNFCMHSQNQSTSRYAEKQITKSEKRVIKIEKFALRNSSSSKYLSVKTNGDLIADRDSIGPWEIFTKEKKRNRLHLKRSDPNDLHKSDTGRPSNERGSATMEDCWKEETAGFFIRTNNFGRYISAIDESRVGAQSDVPKKSKMWFSVSVGASLSFAALRSSSGASEPQLHSALMLPENSGPEFGHPYIASPQPPHLMTEYPPPPQPWPSPLAMDYLAQRYSQPLPPPLPSRPHLSSAPYSSPTPSLHPHHPYPQQGYGPHPQQQDGDPFAPVFFPQP